MPAGISVAGRANVSPRDDPDRLAIGARTAAYVHLWRACRRDEAAKPSDPRAERIADPTSPESTLTPPEAKPLGERPFPV